MAVMMMIIHGYFSTQRMALTSNGYAHHSEFQANHMATLISFRISSKLFPIPGAVNPSSSDNTDWPLDVDENFGFAQRPKFFINIQWPMGVVRTVSSCFSGETVVRVIVIRLITVIRVT
jgi:hypothetical protein